MSKFIYYSNISSSKRCLSQHDLRLSAHFVEKIFIGILLPPIILFGLIGNFLNLLILIGGNKRKISRNHFPGFIGHLDSLNTTKSLDLNKRSICLNKVRIEHRVTFVVTPSAIIQLFVGPVSAKDPYVTLVYFKFFKINK
uniref:G_PROTEIN_RECEP_F1_2 domain-containing protein n=1 Tax=Meloidogyne hapla TaxID=6305 RepID=A0A1I8BAU2_MELHA